MRISEVKSILSIAEGVNFKLESGQFVPDHFHVTEVGVITRDFIDCGGTVRHERIANFQLWDADDYEHRLKPGKLMDIISLSEKLLGMDDLDVEVEYQSETIGKYELEFDGKDFLLISKKTACLAPDKCNVSSEKQKVRLENLATGSSACTAGGDCC